MMRRLPIFIALCVLFAAGNVFAMSINAGENKLDLYTSIRSFAYFTDVSGSDSYRSMSSLKTGMQSNSRVGARWGLENMRAHVEWGFGSTTTTTLRLLYADYAFADNMGTLRVGQFASLAETQTLLARRADNDAGLVGVGSVAQVRRAGASYSIHDFTVQLTTLSSDATNYTGLLPATGAAPEYKDVRFRELLPKIEVAYVVPMFKVFGAYALFQADGVETATNKQKDFSLSAYHLGFAVTPKMDDFYAILTGFYSVNAGLYGVVSTGNGSGGTTNVLPVYDGNGKFKNVSTYGGTLSLGHKVTPTATAEVGVGYQVSTSKPYDKDDNGMGVYGNVTIKPNQWIMVTPEISYIDFMKRPSKADDAKLLQVGLQFRVDI